MASLKDFPAVRILILTAVLMFTPEPSLEDFFAKFSDFWGHFSQKIDSAKSSCFQILEVPMSPLSPGLGFCLCIFLYRPETSRILSQKKVLASREDPWARREDRPSREDSFGSLKESFNPWASLEDVYTLTPLRWRLNCWGNCHLNW